MLETTTTCRATTTLCDRFPSASSRRTRTIRRMQKNRMTTTATSSSSEEEEKEAEPIPPKKSDPFGFDSGRNEGPVPIVPGFDTAEGGKVGPLGTAGISLLLFVLFGGSLFFTSVPRGAVEDMAKMALENDPDAPTNVLRR
ncbi:unnamed protein product [Bathycoccus prasinos]